MVGKYLSKFFRNFICESVHAGLLRDVTGNYTASIVLLNLVTIIAIVAWSAESATGLIREKLGKRQQTFEAEINR